MRLSWFSLVSSVLCISSFASIREAQAQVFLVSERVEPYVDLANIPGITGVTALPFNSADDEFAANIALPFSFNFVGTQYSAVGISSNGWLALGPANLGSDRFNEAIPDTSTPNEFIAFMWDDLDRATGSFGVIGTAPNQTFVIELLFKRFSGPATDDGRVQVWLFESPSATFEVRYGGGNMTGTYNATMGFEGANAAPSGEFRPCSPNCSAVDYTALIDRAVIVGPAEEPELTATFGTDFPRGAFPGASATGTVNLENLGTNTATSVLTNVYLSTDQTLDAADVLIGSATADAANGTTAVQVTVTVPVMQPTGDFFLIADVDADDSWTEVNEGDNEVVGPMFATGYELTPSALSTMQTGINPGENAVFDLEITNNGVPRVGPVEVRLWASVDQLFDAGDTLIGVDTVNLVGNNIETAQAVGVLPALAPGAYFAIAEVDPNNLLAEADENNNFFVAPSPFNTGPDFTVGVIAPPAGADVGVPVDITTTLQSISVPYTGPLSYRLWASSDTNLDPMSDTSLGMFTATFAGEGSLPDTQSVTFPAGLPAGSYFILAEADSNAAVQEVSETNNVGASNTPVLIGFDFSIDAVSFTPGVAQVGDMISVSATLRSLGVAFTGMLDYRVYLSPDDNFDPADVGIYDGTVFVPGLTSATINASFALPSVVPATYRVFIVADPDNTRPEALEDNNAGLAPGTLEIQGADLRVVSLSGPPIAFIERPYRVELTLENTGVADARGFEYAYYLSEDAQIRIFDDQIFLSGSATIAAGASQTFVDMVTMPALTSTQTLFLGVIVNINSTVPETNIGNNLGRIEPPLELLFPIPDLTAELTDTPTAAAGGEDMAITRLISNVGIADAPSFEYSYYLSTNPAIGTDDILLATFTGSLLQGEDDFGIDQVSVPSDIAEGSYYVGLLLDPGGLVTEIDEANNGAVGPQIPVFEADIQFITDTLPGAVLGVEYEVGLFAEGGPLALTWAIQSGALPDGLMLDTNTGILSGVPTAEGVFNFQVRALAGTAYAERDFEIRVTAPTVELEIVTPSLPTAVVGRDYTTRLIAVGGIQPYTWTAISMLPLGLSLAEDGTISGTPEAPGNFPVTVRVEDTLGNSSSRDVALNVINANQTLQISQLPLPAGVVGLDYCEGGSVVIEAENGVDPYIWSLIGDAPPGMTFNAQGELCGTPTLVGSFPMTVRAQDQTGLFDTALFFVDVSGRDLAISTFALPPAKEGEAYEESLSAIRGEEPYTWSVVEAWGALPAGITVGETGAVTGTPSEAGEFAFVVQVIDAQGRLDTQPLSIEVEARSTIVEDGDGGCGCTAERKPARSGFGGLSGALLLLMAGVVLRRRR